MPPFTIRLATPDDALGVNTLILSVAEEPHNTIGPSPGEFDRTVDEDRERIEGARAAENSHFLVAVADDEIIGFCRCFGGDGPTRFTTGLAIVVHANWRDQGVGSALMESMLQWARENPAIHRLDLSVFAHNERAIHLYRKLGFQDEGIRKEAYFKDGRFADGLVMAMIFDHHPPASD